MDFLEDDIVALMTKRVYDMSGIFGDKVSVFINGDRIKIGSFLRYVDLYFKDNEPIVKVYDKEMTNSRWEVMVTYSPTLF